MTRDEDLAKAADPDPDSDWLTQLLAVLPRMAPPAEPRIRIDPPAPGSAVLACRCGRMLDAADMYRRTHRRQKGDAARVGRITCASCADVTMPLGHSIASVIRAVEAEDGAA